MTKNKLLCRASVIIVCTAILSQTEYMHAILLPAKDATTCGKNFVYVFPPTSKTI